MNAIKIITKNKKAFHDFFITDTYEAGVVLTGTEVKSIRVGKVNLTDGWVDIKDGEAFLNNVHISHYSHGNIFNHEERQRRKLLLKKSQINHIDHALATKGQTLIPLKIYFKGQYIKVEIGMAKGKKQFDKRDTEKKKDADREISRALSKK